MKNSLFLLLQAIESVAEEVEKPQPRRQLADIHYETQRLNTGLMQLLSLFRQQKDELPINKEEHFLDELAEELEASNQFYAAHHGIELTTSVKHDGSWFFDQNLILILVNDVIINALRYAKSKVAVEIGVDTINNELVIEIGDDGSGYPLSMLDASRTSPQAMELDSGRTGLGLYFAKLIAQAHQVEDRNGSIFLSNDSALGGSLFTLRLP
ncbi:sensor histidine kinase KdpD [Lysobacter sp. N42]|uniref:sensor histidine kinase n=2 Tax=Gammaproteobacteria TaxID=1236 RepID=UPI001A9ECD4B|nr:ATP-binding protein [Lysobacter sp. N42]